MLSFIYKVYRRYFMKKRLGKLGLLLICSSLLVNYGSVFAEDNSNGAAETQVMEQEVQLEDGTYQSTQSGYNGEITVEVVIADGMIESVTPVDHVETDAVLDRALPLITERIVEAQTPDVDSVAGATISSYAIKRGTAEAIAEAGGEQVEVSISNGFEEGKELEEKEAHQTDLVIVGGGPSGLAAAISAKEEGVENVTVVEKLDILSGNGKFDMNFFDMPNSQAMAENGVEVTQEEFKAVKESSWESEERIDAWIDIAWSLDEWLRDMGVELDHNYGGEKGMSHMAAEDEYAGNHLQHGLEGRAEELGVEFITGTRGVDLVYENDRVVGVSVEDRDYKYDVLADAVVVATGGFSYNPELLEKYAPGAEIVNTSNQMGATGDFIYIAEENDIKLDNMEGLSVFKLILKPWRDLTGAGDGFILVNNESERFVDEQLGGLDQAHAMLEQPDSEVFYIYDQRLYESMYRPQKHVEEGKHLTGENIDDLAEQLGLDAEKLRAEIEDHNAAVEAGEGDSYRETPAEFTIDPDGPVYGASVESAIHMTKGGLVPNERAQVLNNDDEVIPGLYASGEVTNQSGAFSQSVAWGRIAGREAARELMAE